MSEQDSGEHRSERRDEAEEMARLQEQINNLPVGEHILYMMHSLSALAVDRLGLSPEGASRRDVEQARLSIDAFRALLGVLEEARPTEEIAAHRGVLSQLQLAYVGALGGAGVESDGQKSEADAAGTTAESAVETEAVETAPKDDAKPEEQPEKTSPKKSSKPRTSGVGAAKKSGGTGAAKSAKKSSGGSAGKGEKKGT